MSIVDNVIVPDIGGSSGVDVIELLVNGSSRKKMEDTALNFAATNFSNDKVVEGLVKFYSELIA